MGILALSWKLRTQHLIVMHSTSKSILAAYDARIDTQAIEKKMLNKTVKFSLVAIMVAFSMVAFSAVVFG